MAHKEVLCNSKTGQYKIFDGSARDAVRNKYYSDYDLIYVMDGPTKYWIRLGNLGKEICEWNAVPGSRVDQYIPASLRTLSLIFA